MNEVTRLQYLDAMGVTSYLPRQVLPGALPSTLCDWPADIAVFDSPGVIESKQAVAAPEQQQVIHKLQDELLSSRQDTRRPAKKVAKAGNQKREHASAAAGSVQFQLTLFKPVNDMLVLVPAQELGQAHGQLLKNILLAIGINVRGMTPLDNFRWPPASANHHGRDSGRLAGGMDAARETLHALLEGYQSKLASKSILVFAAELGETLFQEEGQVLAFKDCEVHLLPGLQQMLDDREFKKITWQKIAALKK